MDFFEFGFSEFEGFAVFPIFVMWHDMDMSVRVVGADDF